jgi:hypothetical protein
MAAALGAAALAGWLAAAGCPAACPDELAPLLEPPEHPARNMPPPSRTLLMMRPATTPCLVPLAVFRMPL